MASYVHHHPPRAAELELMVEHSDEYARERLSPVPGDKFYLVLSDLLIALCKEATQAKIKLLDYGAGVSPYRPLFPNCNYQRADIAQVDDVDYVIRPDGMLDAGSSSFDLVLSTQVLEHVERPLAYLRECLRVLNPGGRLLASTHGMYEDHGCPYDFRRWTADGLRRDLSIAGFEVLRVEKFTCGPRAIYFLGERYLETESLGRLGRGMSVVLRPHIRRWVHRQLDRKFGAYRVADSNAPGNILYIGLIATARRPVMELDGVAA